MKKFSIKSLIFCLLLAIFVPIEANAQIGKIAKLFGKNAEKTIVKKAGKNVAQKTAREIAEEYATKIMTDNIAANTAKSAAKKELAGETVKKISEKGGIKAVLHQSAENVITKTFSWTMSKHIPRKSFNPTFISSSTSDILKTSETHALNNIKNFNKRISYKITTLNETPATILKTIKTGNTGDKAEAFAKLKQYIDNFPGTYEQKEKFLSQLPDNVKLALSKYRHRIPKKEGIWTGTPGESVWIPDKTATPPNRNYSNLDNKSWQELLDKHGYSNGIPFKNGEMQLKPIAEVKIKYPDTEEFKKMNNTKKREYLQNKAFEELARQRGETIEQAKAFKEKNRYCWHELPDCNTIILVPAEIHNNISHVGGISVYNLVAKIL